MIWSGTLDEWTTSKVAERFVQQGLLTDQHDRNDAHQALDALIQRLRYTLGDYDNSPSIPLPP